MVVQKVVNDFTENFLFLDKGQLQPIVLGRFNLALGKINHQVHKFYKLFIIEVSGELNIPNNLVSQVKMHKIITAISFYVTSE